MDLVVRTPRLPAPGETLTGRSFVTVPGGKGANQAVACARLGAQTRMVGRVGGDLFGTQLLGDLQRAGVITEGIQVDPEQESGVALIAVDDRVENNIIIVPGANGAVGPEDLVRLEEVLPLAKVLMLQLEIPLKISLEAARMAGERGVTVILDPAPAQKLPRELYPLVDVLTPNETETANLVGFEIEGIGFAEKAAHEMLDRGARQVIVKMGALGAYYADKYGGEFYDALEVKAVDTVAAGDAFNGALAVALSEEKSFDEAMRWAVSAGALAVTRSGAQDAMPTRAELEEILGQ